ncbi:fungal-specific transcription factor domain-containing protein [Bimuria novae-zelandiae CBS 107.79]|uniref:Fungal-specific transcription factor domain-containing protein n=1 Tax=Bimuria novae-zelandiae CBS 107.79 TaxID=1447943 RepID=A0A6A5VJK6_9PLEO|nr:fungal-specific transcription factor domain-containing protein [Bimuria novae-zelandiae CBS 107.79]
MEQINEMEGTDSRLQRACDGCRSRKIRCDRAVPCSNCRSSKLTCATTAPTQKPQRQRVHISDEYEKKIDRIEDRLVGIEHLLEALSRKLYNLDLKTEHESSSQSKSRIGTSRSPHSGSGTIPTPFEGETTINRQSEFARELLEQAVGSTPSIIENAEIKAALTSLQDMVTRQGVHTNTMTTSSSFPFSNKSLAELDHTQLERPPWEIVNEVIDKASVYPTMSFVVVFPFLKMPNVKETFRDAYQHPADASAGRRLLVFGVLTHLFYEFSCYPVVDKRVESYRSHGRVCERQMEVALSQLDFYLSATYENILGLLVGSAHAIELCKPSLCWTMISTATHLAQNLGYHRYETMKDDPAEERNAKIIVFWFIYMMDKTLSLRLGRASIIQDWDLSLPYPDVDSDHTRFGSLVQQGQKGTQMLLYWIGVAQIQGQVYEKLFSPAGFLRPPEERARTAKELVESLNKCWSERGETVKLTFPGSFSYIGDIFYHADVVMHYSTCALIQRAISPDNVSFSHDCLESSRAALVAHQRCAAQFNIKGKEELWSGYIHWAILQAPFTPFIVIFCHAVLDCNPSDLNSLSEFVISLESCRTVSEGADRLYKMCHLFLQVARLYVEAKTKEAASVPTSTSDTNHGGYYPQDSSISLNTMTQFDPYLSALGLMPNAASWSMSTLPSPGIANGMEGFLAGSFDANVAPSGSVMGAGNPTNVQNWFSGSRYLLNLMEDDIQMPDFSL